MLLPSALITTVCPAAVTARLETTSEVASCRGSIRELADNSGAVQARYDYEPYGRRTKVSGSIDADFGFTGHYFHQSSGLRVALYRAYDADLGRWVSRDPIAEGGGFNLYGYVSNNPVRFTD